MVSRPVHAKLRWKLHFVVPVVVLPIAVQLVEVQAFVVAPSWPPIGWDPGMQVRPLVAGRPRMVLLVLEQLQPVRLVASRAHRDSRKDYRWCCRR